MEPYGQLYMSKGRWVKSVIPGNKYNPRLDYIPGLDTTQAGPVLVAEFLTEMLFVWCTMHSPALLLFYQRLIYQGLIYWVLNPCMDWKVSIPVDAAWDCIYSLGSNFWLTFPLTCTAGHKVPCYIHAFIFFLLKCICSCWNSSCLFPFIVPASQDPLNLKLIFYVSLFCCWFLTK